MCVFADYVIGASNDSAVHKFVVIRVLFYKPESVLRIYHPCVWTTGNGIHNVVCHSRVGNSLQNLIIFSQYVIAYT